MENAYETLLELGGLEAEQDYDYDGVDESCKFNKSKVAVRVTGGKAGFIRDLQNFT